MKSKQAIQKGPAIHHSPIAVWQKTGKIQFEIESLSVKVMAVDGIWAMVRRPGCAPYVCHIKELEQP
jgi:phage host-nuclease inhibitor protein Gam